VLFIELGSRRVHLAGCTPSPSGAWVVQQAEPQLHQPSRADAFPDPRSRQQVHASAFGAQNGLRMISTPSLRLVWLALDRPGVSEALVSARSARVRGVYFTAATDSADSSTNTREQHDGWS
jgi:hypothetical protein